MNSVLVITGIHALSHQDQAGVVCLSVAALVLLRITYYLVVYALAKPHRRSGAR